jgi:hypothetical protein
MGYLFGSGKLKNKERTKMLYDKDKDIFDKLRRNAKGVYGRFSQGDIEYIIFSMTRLSLLEDKFSPTELQRILDDK